MTIKHYLQQTRRNLRMLNGINFLCSLLGLPVLLLLMIYANSVITMVCIAVGFTQIVLILQSRSICQKIADWEPFESELMWVMWLVNSLCVVILWGYMIDDIWETAHDPQRAASFTCGASMFHGLCQVALMSTIRRLRVCQTVLEAHTTISEGVQSGQPAIV